MIYHRVLVADLNQPVELLAVQALQVEFDYFVLVHKQ